MALLNKGVAKDIGILAVAVMLVQTVLSNYVYPLLGKTTEGLFAITAQTAVTSPTIGNKILGYISGVIPIGFGSFGVWIAMFIGTFIILLAGYYVYSMRWAPKGKNIYQRLWLILLYGTAVLYVVVLVTKVGDVSNIALPILIGLGLNYLFVALAVTFLAKYVKALRI